MKQFAISEFRVIAPLISTIELLDKPFGQESLEVANKDDVVLAVKINPAFIAAFGISALCYTCLWTVENLIQRLLVDIAQLDIKVLTQWHVSIAVNDETAHDALAAQPQPSIAPLIIKSHEVIVLLCLVDVGRYAAHKIGRIDQPIGGVKESHRAINADAHVNVIAQGHVNNVLHVFERVPWR